MFALHRTLQSAGRRAITRWRRRGLVLLYHRVADRMTDPQHLCVSRARFAAHLEILKREAEVMPLAQLVSAAADRTLPDRAIAITFDDGYADVLAHAIPVLEEHDMASTVFVTTGAVASGAFWWDELEQLLLSPGEIAASARVPIRQANVEYDFHGVERYRPDDVRRYAGWSVADRETPTLRHHAYRDLCGRLRPFTDQVRRHALDALRSVVTLATGEQGGRPLTIPELGRLGAARGVTVGSHTTSHAPLTSLAIDEQRREIAGARDQLQQWTGQRSTAFAYPFGGDADVDAAVVMSARYAGMTLACTTMPGAVHAGTDWLQIPRVNVRNWPGCEFRQRCLAGW